MPEVEGGSIEFAGKDGRFFLNFRNWLWMMMQRHEPDVVVFEAPILSGARTANWVARRLQGMAAITEMVVAAGLADVFEAHLQSIKKHATGNAKAGKKQMIDAARAAGWEPEDDNHADALWLWDYACHEWRRHHPVKKVA